jgi:hypothetical protein
MMKRLTATAFLFLAISLTTYAQTRTSTPDMVFGEEPIGLLEDDVNGWTYSLDGKWMKGENVVYPRVQSRNNEKLEKPPCQFGIDNFSKMAVHEIQYGKDTLFLLVKFFENGYFKYPRTQSGWKSEKGLHYFVFKKPKQHIANITDTLRHTFTAKLINSGTLTDVSHRRYLDKIEERINLEERSNRFLYFDFEFYQKTDVLRFMIYANHEVFHDLRGTITDLDISGKTLFGTPQLLDYIYFETTFTAFRELKLF